MAPAASANFIGSIGNTVSGVPPAAHTTSCRRRLGSATTGSLFGVAKWRRSPGRIAGGGARLFQRSSAGAAPIHRLCQRHRVDSAITGHQSNHRPVVNHEDKGLDDGADITTDGGGGVGCRPGPLWKPVDLDFEPEQAGPFRDSAAGRR